MTLPQDTGVVHNHSDTAVEKEEEDEQWAQYT